MYISNYHIFRYLFIHNTEYKKRQGPPFRLFWLLYLPLAKYPSIMIRFGAFMALVLLAFSPLSMVANIRLPAIFGDNMVLQQNSRVRIWGWGDPGEKVFITSGWSPHADSVVVNSDGKWEVRIQAPPAGGPWNLTLKGWNTIQLKNLMSGEVWLCSGQSNMEWSTNNKNKQILDELPNSANDQIRLFHIPRTTAETPQDNCEGEWMVCGPETLKGFSAVGYFFGKQLQEKLGVPVGLVMSAWGGTPVEPWTPAAVIENNRVMKQWAEVLRPNPWGPHRPGVIFNGMIAPVIKFDFAGVIWYQGESNTGTYQGYSTTFTGMIGSWREMAQKNLPFYYVQIAPYAYSGVNTGALLQEQQTRTLGLGNTGMVVITDLVDDVKNIHPENKKDVSLRLANLALAKTYHLTLTGYQSPIFQRMEIRKNEISLYFDHAEDGLVIKGKTATEFFIAGEDKVFQPAEVKVVGNKIIVKNKKISQPVAVRYGFGNTSIGNVFSKSGLPVTPFRTDNWE